VRVDYLKGMGRVGSRFVLIMDVDRVLAADELIGPVAPEPETLELAG
jgi:hypothetical protein